MIVVNRTLGGAAAASLFALILAGCVAPGQAYESALCGRQVTYHPDDLKPCARGATGCTLQSGQEAYHVYYSSLDSGVMEHEKEHVCGMRHREPWVNVSGNACTEVLEGGGTAWKKGDIMCRLNAGSPVRITDPNLLATIASSTGWARQPKANVMLASLTQPPRTGLDAEYAMAPQSGAAPAAIRAAAAQTSSLLRKDTYALPAALSPTGRARRDAALWARAYTDRELAHSGRLGPHDGMRIDTGLDLHGIDRLQSPGKGEQPLL